MKHVPNLLAAIGDVVHFVVPQTRACRPAMVVSSRFAADGVPLFTLHVFRLPEDITFVPDAIVDDVPRDVRAEPASRSWHPKD